MGGLKLGTETQRLKFVNPYGAQIELVLMEEKESSSERRFSAERLVNGHLQQGTYYEPKDIIDRWMARWRKFEEKLQEMGGNFGFKGEDL